MKIVEANKFHIPIIIEMLKHYRSVTPVSFFKDIDDEKYITGILTQMLLGKGVVLLSYKDDTPTGMLLAFIDNSIWDNKLCILRELAYWVEPEFRGTSAGYRLLSKYNEVAQSLSDMGRIKTWTISKMVNSPDLDYGKLGYRKIEETWSMS